MLKIGEFSKITQVSVRMLRYYDENGLLVPEQTDPWTGYRLYSAGQIEILNRIIFLRDLGFGVSEIKMFLENWEASALKEALLKKGAEIEQEIQKREEQLLRLQSSLFDLEREKIDYNTQVVIKEIPGCHVWSIRRIVSSYFQEGRLWQELSKEFSGCTGRQKRAFSIYHDQEYKEKDVDIEVCVETDESCLPKNPAVIRRQVLPVAHAACFMIYGPYERISGAYQEFALWLEEHPVYRMKGENRQICHVSAADGVAPEQYVTELLVPVEFNG